MPNRQNTISTDTHLLTTLVCPQTGAPLNYSKEKSLLFSRAAKLAFPLRDGIPILVISEAMEMTEAEFKSK